MVTRTQAFDALLHQVFSELYARQEAAYPESVCLGAYADLSAGLAALPVCAPLMVRHVAWARDLSGVLIDEAGQLDRARLAQQIEWLRESCFPLDVRRRSELKMRAHVLAQLQTWQSQTALAEMLQRIERPENQARAWALVRSSLGLRPGQRVDVALVRRACFAAVLVYLRQSVGACFATAPAILLQRHNPRRMLEDLEALLHCAELVRDQQGRSVRVPLNMSLERQALGASLVHFGLSVKSQVAAVVNSPVVCAAARAADCWEQTSLQADLTQALMDYLQPLLAQAGSVDLSVRALLRGMLQVRFDLTEQELEAHRNRPAPMVNEDVMRPLPKVLGDKSAECAQFETAFERVDEALAQVGVNPLLKAWEYSLASFAEHKSNFTRWNLYTSLGLDPKDAQGIGACLYQHVQTRLTDMHQQSEGWVREAEILFSQVKLLEGRLSRVEGQDSHRVQAEYRACAREYRTLTRMIEESREKSQRFSGLFQEWVDAYVTLFPLYFQEVYDANLHLQGAGCDAPAGFRLFFRDGRQTGGIWRAIDSATAYVQALFEFFRASEVELMYSEAFSDVKDEIQPLVTQVMQHVRTDGFLVAALARMAQAHGVALVANPLQNLDRIEKKPWEYVSGGSMVALLQSYFELPELPVPQEAPLVNGEALFGFLLQSLRSLGAGAAVDGLLLNAPAHSCVLQPQEASFRSLWQSHESPEVLWQALEAQGQAFYGALHLSRIEMDYLQACVAERVPEIAALPVPDGPLQPRQWRAQVAAFLPSAEQMRQVDSVLFGQLPLVAGVDVADKARTLVQALNLEVDVLDAVSEVCARLVVGPCLGGGQVLALALTGIAVGLGQAYVAADIPRLARDLAWQQGLVSPPPVVFADSNWLGFEFGFVFNPGLDALMVWQVDELRIEGEPVTIQTFEGDGGGTWGVFGAGCEWGVS